MNRPDTDRRRARDAVASARAVLAAGLEERSAPDYPISALGSLSAAAQDLATYAQLEPAIAGQSLLAAASLVTCGLFNVETLASPKPIALYLATLADSGDGKSEATSLALRPVDGLQRRLASEHQSAMADHKEQLARLAAEPKRRKDAAAQGHTDLPEAPAFRIVRDATLEGIQRELEHGASAQGVFSDEAAALVGGHSMSPDNRMRSAAAFNGLYDNGRLSISRASRPRIERHGRRLAMHWLIQPQAAADAFTDPSLQQLGFWPRFLLAWPSPAAPRTARARDATTPGSLIEYWGRCDDWLSQPLFDDVDRAPVLPLDADAHRLVAHAFNEYELLSRAGCFRPIKPFGIRAAEQACRIAGVLSAFSGRREVCGDDMDGALQLVRYSLDTWQAVIEDGAADPRHQHALQLYAWMLKQPRMRGALRDILNRGPACVRSADKREAALDVLEAHDLVVIEHGFAQAIPVQSATGRRPSEATPRAFR